MNTLLFMLSDFDHEETEREEHDLECSCEFDDSDAEPLGGNLFRVLAPMSVTPFGPLGPALTLGQIIEAEPVSTASGGHFKPAVRSWRVFCEQRDVLNRPDISQDLNCP
jgi:hypothetical protein